MTKVYLMRFGMDFDALAGSEPFPLSHVGTLPEKLKLVLPSPIAHYISRTTYFELSNAITIDGFKVYVEIEEPVGSKS